LKIVNATACDKRFLLSVLPEFIIGVIILIAIFLFANKLYTDTDNHGDNK